MLKPLHIIIVLSLIAGQAFAQNNKADSLRIVLQKTANDTNRVNILNQLSSSYWYSDPLQTIEYARQAIELAQQLDFKTGLTSGYNNTGVGYYQQNKYEQALEWYSKAITIHKKTGNYRGEANVLSNMGLIFWKKGDLPVAVQHYLKALDIWENHHNDKEASSVFDNLGNVYNDQGDYDRALSYYFKALESAKKYNKTGQETSMTLSNIGTAYMAQEKYNDALKYFLESLDHLTDADIESRAVSLSNIGLTYTGLKNNGQAIKYLSEAFVLQQQMGDNDGMVPTMLGLAKSYLEKGKLKEANDYATRALELAIKIDDKGSLAEGWLMRSDLAQKQGDYKNAYQYFHNYVGARDSASNKENIYKIAHLQAGYETQKKQTEIELLKKEQEQQAFRRNTIGAGLIALLIIAALIVSRQRLKLKQNNQLVTINERLIAQSQQLEEQTKKLRELDQVKSTFFANISHEFRTPLTLILNSLVDRISSVKISGNTEELEQLEVMHRNAKRLLTLINQLLDLSKLDAKQMKLSVENGDLTHLLNVVYASFSSLSSSKQIHFSVSIPEEQLLCRFDPDKVEKILYNLLSNAFKFTPIGGTVKLHAAVSDDQTIRIMVEDSGRGIPEDQHELVFNRFYQGKQYYSDEQGTGIGLALTKELVELHGGKISVESGKDTGASFVVLLPFIPATGDPVFTPEQKPVEEIAISATNNPSPDNELPYILIVEDNADLRHYIKQHLSGNYNITEAENGKTGLEKAISTIPDLVISDWMMPEMDGITLCNHLKKDERTSHIPLIMLTALASDDAKLQGLETGADDYLTKPFDNRELQARVKNLIDSRRQLRERFSRELHLGPKNIQVSSVDEKFLEKVMQAVETYMGDPEFSMEKFGQQVSLSRMQLHRKLKALTGESPGDFLRTMRLQRAKRLLESRTGNVSEIAYEVGFNNLSYFSKCYREQFGISPNESISSNVTKLSGNVTP